MAFKLPGNLPTNHSDIEEIVDYVECHCLTTVSQKVSLYKVTKQLLLGSDEILVNGIEDESDLFQNKFGGVLTEIERRIQYSSGNYPFKLRNDSLILKANDDYCFWVYCYLLIATRNNMKENAVLAGIDGALLFERVSLKVAENYFGDRANSFLFGTSHPSTFPNRINMLIQQLGEGVQYINHNIAAPRAQDDKLDIAIWKGFRDRRTSKLIAFGQCKTGTSWDGHLSQLQPDAFCSKWFFQQPVETPVRMFFICDHFYRDAWYTKARDAGIIFDRIRILDYLPVKLPKEVYQDLVNWTYEAINTLLLGPSSKIKAN